MSGNFDSRIDRLKQRRKGVNEIYAMDSSIDGREILLEKSRQQEEWENRASGKSATKYALGSMQEVDPVYTRVSNETGERIENQLYKRLLNKGITTSFRLQGSVPLNIHIKGISDVDILAIDEQVFMSDNRGCKSDSYLPTTKNTIDILKTLRDEIEDSLESAFPAAKIHTDNAKSVKITGGSLARDVDVVPSIWWNTANYQSSDREVDRGVAIFNKKTTEKIYNTPFLHIELIKNKCNSTLGGLRKSIRMLKNIKADAELEGIKIGLSSFDIAAMMYHADTTNLRQGFYYELAILSETQRWLDWLWRNYTYAQSLEVPDGTRKIFDTPEKKDELCKLSLQVDSLALAVIKELNTKFVENHMSEEMRRYMSSSSVQ